MSRTMRWYGCGCRLCKAFWAVAILGWIVVLVTHLVSCGRGPVPQCPRQPAQDLGGKGDVVMCRSQR